MAKESYKSRVYTDRPAYVDFDAPAKFQAIQSIVGRRLIEHLKTIQCVQADRMRREKLGGQITFEELIRAPDRRAFSPGKAMLELEKKRKFQEIARRKQL